jgi:hypothetical protein
MAHTRPVAPSAISRWAQYLHGICPSVLSPMIRTLSFHLQGGVLRPLNAGHRENQLPVGYSTSGRGRSLGGLRTVLARPCQCGQPNPSKPKSSCRCRSASRSSLVHQAAVKVPMDEHLMPDRETAQNNSVGWVGWFHKLQILKFISRFFIHRVESSVTQNTTSN